MVDWMYRLETFEHMISHVWKSCQCGKSNRAASILENFCKKDPIDYLKKISCKDLIKNEFIFSYSFYLNIDVTSGPRGEKLWGFFPNSQINFCWQTESSKPRDSKRRSNLERSGSVFQSFISFWSSILLFWKLLFLPLLNSVLKPIEGKRKDTGTPIKRSETKQRKYK